jgi:hypothetical protein
MWLAAGLVWLENFFDQSMIPFHNLNVIVPWQGPTTRTIESWHANGTA